MRRVGRHETRASAAHDAALDTEFRVGERVRTIDGVIGRIIFVDEAFSPGNTAYQVTLDNGMGGGTYLGSQLRAIPEGYRGSSPASQLPAGVTAALEAEAAEIHTADLDYPEMGSILHDRPDPASQFTVIGMRHQAEDYAQGYDERDDDPNGGPQDVGIYWEAPAEQQWRDENLGEPEEIPAPEVPGLGQEEFEQSFGKISTTINGTQIDDHGDAPGHGADPENTRAARPDSYDDESTEGEGDQKWSDPLPGVDKKQVNGATVGMYPEGISAGGGPGISVGPFAASRVPWTDEERTNLHSWDNELAASAGDFVPSSEYGKSLEDRHFDVPGPAEEVIERALQAQGSYAHGELGLCAIRHHGPCTYPGMGSWEAESLKHPRPRDFTSQLHEIPAERRARNLQDHPNTATHELAGYINGQKVASAYLQVSDDQRAVHVTNLHTHARRGKGSASALMDDLYSHAKQNGQWINHGGRTEAGLSWWNSYREPHPELNVHNVHPDTPMPASHDHPGGQPWSAYWSPHKVAEHMWANHLSDPEGKHDGPHFAPQDHEDDPHHERWQQSHNPEGQEPHEAELEGHWAGGIARLHPDDHEIVHDPYVPPAHRARHLLSALNRASDIHHSGWTYDKDKAKGAIQDAARLIPVEQHRAGHYTAFLLNGEHEEGHPALVGSATFKPTSRGSATTSHDFGDPVMLRLREHEKTGVLAGIRVKVHGPDDFSFSHQNDDEDEANSLETGDPGETEQNDSEDPGNSLDEGGPDGGEGSPDEEPGGEEAPEEDAGHLPTGGAPKQTPRAPNVPQRGARPEQWPLATAPVQEGMPPWSQGRDSPTRKINPAQMMLPAMQQPGQDDQGDDPGDGKPMDKEAALALFTAAASSPGLRFEVTAAWRDVVAKAKRIRTAGRVRITHASRGMVIGEVGGDHDVYECGIQRPAGRPQSIQHWACGCPWASFHQDSSYPGRLNGRPCSHVYALQLEAASRGMHGREITQDDPIPESLGYQVVVKSMPPWGQGGWRQTWLAPAASKTAAAAREERTLVTVAVLALLAAGEPAEDISDLAATAGLDVTAELAASDKLFKRHLSVAHGWEDDFLAKLAAQGHNLWGAHEDAHSHGGPAQVPHSHSAPARPRPARTAAANDPWGDNNYAEHPPAKPYGATEAPNPNMDPGSYGFLTAPDPENWAEIPETGLIGPMHSEASLPGLDQGSATAGDTPDSAVPYGDRAAGAGLSTSLDPRDPQGIRMEEALSPDEQGAEYEQHLISHHGVPAGWASRWDHEHHLRAHEDAVKAQQIGEPLEGITPHPYHETDWEIRQGRGRWADAAGPHEFTGSAERELPDAKSLGEGHHPRECTCTTCEYDRYHAKHAVQAALHLALVELEANAEGELHDEPEPALPETTAVVNGPDIQVAGADPLAGSTTGGPGMSMHDEDLSPSDTSIQTIGTQNIGGDDSAADLSFSVSPQENGAEAYADDPVTQFQATAAAQGLMNGGTDHGDGDIAAAAREFLSKTADVLPDAEAAALIAEGKGIRARNLDLLRLEGTHYEDIDDQMDRRGLNLDNYDDDLVSM